ncbi:DUF1983 domain-containing protein [Paraburkholderia sp. SIMBA_049]
MSDVLDDVGIEIRTSGLAVGLGTEVITLGLQSNALSVALEDDPISGVLETKNLVIRLYSPDGSTLGSDFAPFFKGDPGGLTPADRDLLVQAIQDTVIAAAVAQAELTAKSAAEAALQAEVMARQLADDVFTAEITEVSTTLQTKTDSIAIDIETVGARIDENVAAIQTEQVARADSESAISLRIDQVVAVSEGNTAAVNTEQIARTDADSAIGMRIDTVVANVGLNTAAITSAEQARADGDSALSTRIDQLSATVGSSSSTITDLQTALATANQSNASALLALSTTLNNHTATIQTNASSIDGLSAQYTVKIDNNGFISGYGLTSTPVNGVPVSTFTILADKFKVTLPGYPTVVPFIIQTVNGVPTVSITTAVIGDATITNAKIANLAVDTAKIADAAITFAKIGTAQIGTAHIGVAQIDSARIGANAVSTMVCWGGLTSGGGGSRGYDFGYTGRGGAVMMIVSGLSGSAQGGGDTGATNGGATAYFNGSAVGISGFGNVCCAASQVNGVNGGINVHIDVINAQGVTVTIFEALR